MGASNLPDSLEELDFMECDTCRAKPGMPVLCKSCLHNRHAIWELSKGVQMGYKAALIANKWKFWFYFGTALLTVAYSILISLLLQKK